MRLLIPGLMIITLTSCGELDNFDVVTKNIVAPDTVRLDKEFTFRLILRNDGDKQIQLTVDKNVGNSIEFLPNWRCDDKLLVPMTSSLIPFDADLQVHYLKKNDSLTFDFTGRLIKNGIDSLVLVISNYDKRFKLKRPNCSELTMSLNGMWLPGDFNPLDAMLDYGFGREIIILE